MATLASTAWEIVRLIFSLCLAASVIGWIVEWRRGHRSVRDERGRLKPGAAIFASLAALVAAGFSIALVDQWLS
jgi:Trk-type K+ transport system membrane component